MLEAKAINLVILNVLSDFEIHDLRKLSHATTAPGCGGGGRYISFHREDQIIVGFGHRAVPIFYIVWKNRGEAFYPSEIQNVNMFAQAQYSHLVIKCRVY